MVYLVRRTLHGAFLLFGVSLLVFALLAMAPGDFFSELRLNPAMSGKSIEALRAEYGFHRSLPARYFQWLRAVGRGDWGRSLSYQAPVWPLLRDRAGNTLLLTTTSVMLAWLLALGLGIYSAATKRRWVAPAVGVSTSSLLGIPDLVICLVLLVFAVKSQAFPVGGMVSLDHDSMDLPQRLLDSARHLALPMLALMLLMVPSLTRHVRASMLEALAAPAIQTARALGISRTRTLFRHALPLAANPLISLFGLSIAALLSGSLLVEVIMGWPGLGPLLLEAILARDIYVIIGAVIWSTLFLVSGNLLADLLLLAVDPRVRREGL